jgi:hypothetical protein
LIFFARVFPPEVLNAPSGECVWLLLVARSQDRPTTNWQISRVLAEKRNLHKLNYVMVFQWFSPIVFLVLALDGDRQKPLVDLLSTLNRSRRYWLEFVHKCLVGFQSKNLHYRNEVKRKIQKFSLRRQPVLAPVPKAVNLQPQQDINQSKAA